VLANTLVTLTVSLFSCRTIHPTAQIDNLLYRSNKGTYSGLLSGPPTRKRLVTRATCAETRVRTRRVSACPDTVQRKAKQVHARPRALTKWDADQQRTVFIRLFAKSRFGPFETVSIICRPCMCQHVPVWRKTYNHGIPRLIPNQFQYSRKAASFSLI